MDDTCEPLTNDTLYKKTIDNITKGKTNDTSFYVNSTRDNVIDIINSICPNMIIAKIVFGLLLMNPLTKCFIPTASVNQVYSRAQVISLHKFLIYSLLFFLGFMMVFFDLSESIIQLLYFLTLIYLLIHIYFYSNEFWQKKQ